MNCCDRYDSLEEIHLKREREERVKQIEDLDGEGHTPLLCAVCHNSLKAVECLMRYNANIAATDPHYRWGVLHECVEHGDWPKMITLLLEHGTHPLARTKGIRLCI